MPRKTSGTARNKAQRRSTTRPSEERRKPGTRRRIRRMVRSMEPRKVQSSQSKLPQPSSSNLAVAHFEGLAQLPQFGWQVFCCQWGYVEVFTTSLQIRCGQGFAGRGIEAGLLDGLWGG